jgi:serine/threonine-protein kinase
VQIYDFDMAEDGLYYMVMEYIEGMSLEKYLTQHEGPMTAEAALPLFQQIAAAVHFAHQKGTIHRDIKPANIMLDAHNHIYLADFGIAQIVGASRLTESGVATGTPSFMAPEQVLGQPVTTAVDIYALGVILYQMLTAHMPYEGTTPATLMIKQATEPPIPPSRFVEISLQVEEVILKSMAMEPANRYASAADMAQALTTAVSGPGTAVSATISQTLGETPTMTAQPATMAGATAVNSTTSADTQVVPVRPRTPPWIWAVIGIGALALIAVGFLLARNNNESAPLDATDTAATPAPTVANMRFIPAGTFLQGSEEGNSDERPSHEVSLSAFFIDTTEVTNEAYAAFIAETGAAVPATWPQPEPSIWEVMASEP